MNLFQLYSNSAILTNRLPSFPYPIPTILPHGYAHYEFYHSFGSNASLRPSPRKFKLSSVALNPTQGQRINHQ